MAAVNSDQVPVDPLVSALSSPAAYPRVRCDSVSVQETHISWVFLVGEFAFKVKKPVKTDFLDYSTVELREHFCREELRLDSRYSDDLYLDVVNIARAAEGIRVEGAGDVIDYAVKMRRFPTHDLLSQCVQRGDCDLRMVSDLAAVIARVHQDADRAVPDQDWGQPTAIRQQAIDNLQQLSRNPCGDVAELLGTLHDWTSNYFEEHLPELGQRLANGFIRECHGDLHLANIVNWHGRLTPFDGIEFNDDFRWIDTLSDVAFTTMDFAAHGRVDFSRSFINRYLELTGDHASPSLLRWYLVYRALTRAKVAAMRAEQQPHDPVDGAADCAKHIELAHQYSLRQPKRLWITHGVSGSGKTTVSEKVVQQTGAIRLRSDIERKRHFGLSLHDRLSDHAKQRVYSESASHATYTRMSRIATGILRAGFPVVIDATFLKRRDRQLFQRLAEREDASFTVLDCRCDPETLRLRVKQRLAEGQDESEADVQVLEEQLKNREPLTPAEMAHVIDAADRIANSIEPF